MDNRIRFTNGSRMSLLKAAKAIEDEGELALGMMVSPDGTCRCAVGVLEGWTRLPHRTSASNRTITPKTRRTLFSVNDQFLDSTELERKRRALHVAAWLRAEATR